MDLLKEYLAFFAMAVSAGGVIFTWFTRRSKENSGRLGKAEKTLISHDRRIQALENDFNHLPTKDQISEILVAIAQISATVASTNSAIRRLEDDIRAQKKDT